MLLSTALELGANDRKVDVIEVLDRLQVHDDRILHKKIEAMTTTSFPS